MTSRLETSRYRDFSQFFESIGLCLENFGLEKKSQYRSRKYLVSKKVSVSVSKIFSLEKTSRYRSRKYLVSKKSLGIGLENFGLKKSLGIGLENIWSRKKVLVSVSKKISVSVSMKFFGLVTQCSSKGLSVCL